MKGIMGLNVKPGESREENDFYATHPMAIIPLMRVLGWEKGGKHIYEPGCGKGHLSEMIKLYGHTMVCTDLIDRGYGITGVDFLQPNEYDNGNYDAVIMNPPYKYAIEFIRKSLKLAPTVCAFLRITFLESAKRAEFFKQYPPRFVAVFIERIPSSKDAKFDPKESSSVCYAWFIWERGFTGRPEILWI